MQCSQLASYKLVPLVARTCAAKLSQQSDCWHLGTHEKKNSMQADPAAQSPNRMATLWVLYRNSSGHVPGIMMDPRERCRGSNWGCGQCPFSEAAISTKSQNPTSEKSKRSTGGATSIHRAPMAARPTIGKRLLSAPASRHQQRRRMWAYADRCVHVFCCTGDLSQGFQNEKYNHIQCHNVLYVPNPNFKSNSVASRRRFGTYSTPYNMLCIYI